MKLENDTTKEKQQLKSSTVPLGRLFATPGVLASIPLSEYSTAIRRHRICDWGEACEEDWESNNKAMIHGSRVFSVYTSTAGVRFWIITEADRSDTTVLLPNEY